MPRSVLCSACGLSHLGPINAFACLEKGITAKTQVSGKEHGITLHWRDVSEDD